MNFPSLAGIPRLSALLSLLHGLLVGAVLLGVGAQGWVFAGGADAWSLWVGVGLAGLGYAVGLVLAIMGPGWLRWRQRLARGAGTATERQVEEWVARVAVQGGQRVPTLLWDRDLASKCPGAITAGGWGGTWIRINAGLLAAFENRMVKDPLFDGILLHELGHIANKDIFPTLYTENLNRVLLAGVALVLVPMDLMLAARWGQLSPMAIGMAGLLNLRLVPMLLALELLRRGVARNREYEADARAAAWGALEGVKSVVQRLGDRVGAGRQAWALHPSREARLQRLAAPLSLLPVSGWVSGIVGVLVSTVGMAGIALVGGLGSWVTAWGDYLQQWTSVLPFGLQLLFFVLVFIVALLPTLLPWLVLMVAVAVVALRQEWGLLLQGRSRGYRWVQRLKMAACMAAGAALAPLLAAVDYISLVLTLGPPRPVVLVVLLLGLSVGGIGIFASFLASRLIRAFQQRPPRRWMPALLSLLLTIQAAPVMAVALILALLLGITSADSVVFDVQQYAFYLWQGAWLWLLLSGGGAMLLLELGRRMQRAVAGPPAWLHPPALILPEAPPLPTAPAEPPPLGRRRKR